MDVLEDREASARRRPHPVVPRMATYALLPIALVVTGLFVSTSSYAVFNARTTNTGDRWTAGTVVLQHDANGTYSATSTAAFFSASGSTTGLQPGAAVTKCIDVRSTGSLPSGEVRLYASVPVGSIASRLNVVVTQGTAGSTCAAFTAGSTLFSGYLNTFATASTGKDWSTGYSTGWTPSVGGNETRAFQFTATLDSGVRSDLQGSNATFDAIWETQGT